MRSSVRVLVLTVAVVAAAFGWAETPNAQPARQAALRAAGGKPAPAPTPVWAVDDLRPGMKGHGLTVFKGAKIERFDAEVLGVLKNTSPGRDMVLMRLSGCNLEKTGVIAGMSGSPVYIDNKLVGAVGYAWQYGKEPIAGVTPFVQMAEAVETFERRDLAKKQNAKRFDLQHPIRVGDREFASVTVGPNNQERKPTAADGMWLMPLQTPLAASGFTNHSLDLLRDRAGWSGIVPVQAGAAPAHVLKEAKELVVEPGAPLAISMVQGDFDLSGIGTVTHVEGDRVYGWGHPFMSLGGCELPLMTGYIHTVNPRLTVSFKMGSPVQCVGVIDADVSTCIAGWMGRKPDLLPLKMTVQREEEGRVRTYNCQVARHKSLMPQLVYTTLTNAVDQEGDLPEEMTAELSVRVEFDDGTPPLILQDTYSGAGYSGGRAPANLYSQVGTMLQMLIGQNFKPIRIKKVDVDTRIMHGRNSAEIESVRLDSECYEPGDTLKATVYLKPFKDDPRRQTVELKLPKDMPEGNYTAILCDESAATRMRMRDDPNLGLPSKLEHVLDGLRLQAAAKRTHLAIRVPVTEQGIAIDGKAMPNLPGSMVEMLGNSKRTGALTFGGAIYAKTPTEWVIQGMQVVKFTVRKDKRLTID